MGENSVINKYILPDLYGMALVGGYWECLTESEIKELGEWLKEKDPGHAVEMEEGTGGFRWRNDVNNLGGDCHVVSFIKWDD